MGKLPASDFKKISAEEVKFHFGGSADRSATQTIRSQRNASNHSTAPGLASPLRLIFGTASLHFHQGEKIPGAWSPVCPTLSPKSYSFVGLRHSKARCAARSS